MATQMLNQVSSSKGSFISTGCTKLDNFLRGGLPLKGITQIYGESGSGKTQLALQLCLSAQVAEEYLKINRGAAYICTESAFPSIRLNELLKKSPVVQNYPISNEMIFIEHISTTEDLVDCIFNSARLQLLLSKFKIKLLVIDSIAATFRAEYDSSYLITRARNLRSIGYQLQNIAKLYRISVVCINQVTGFIGKSSIEHISTKEQPSLGITWANMVTNSIYMYKKSNRRFLHNVGASYLPCESIEFEILDSGIRATD